MLCLQKESKIKKFLILLVFIFITLQGAEAKYDTFITEQMIFIDRLNNSNITKDEITDILTKQKYSYRKGLEEIMSNKQAYLDKAGMYDDEIFALQKIINVNKRAGNTYAVLRDEVQVKSYKILKNQHKMMERIFDSLDNSDGIDFSKKLIEYIEINKLENKKLMDVDYRQSLEIESNSKALKQAKQNIKEFYALQEISDDVINYLYASEHKIHRLNKYSKYHLIGVVLLINNSAIAQTINPILEIYGLNIVKLLLIVIVVFLIYLTSKFVFAIVERNINHEKNTKKYSKEILKVISKPLGRLVLIININAVLYIYNDFASLAILTKFFNMLYAAILTFMFFKIVNVIAKIKLTELDASTTQIKNDVINVGIKILNFIILILGLLVILHFAGANLTAVLSGLGIGGFAVALAAKDSLANFFGTLSILFSDVLSQGDWIEVNGKEGVVIEIGTRVTTLRTFDNALIAIPNAILATQDVKNWNKRTLGRRIKMNLGIKYGSSSSDIKNAVNEIREMLDIHPDIATENTAINYKARSGAKLVSTEDAHGIKKTLLVYLDEFSDSSMNILVYCFTKSVDWKEWLETKEEIMHRIMEIFEKNNIEFAFPSMSLYHENMKHP